MPKLLVANWKMHGDTAFALSFAEGLLRFLGGRNAFRSTLVVCPPAVLLAPLAAALRGSGVYLGAQDVSAQPSGPFTGDVSVPLVKDAGAAYVIVGHSERRTHHGETDAHVAGKCTAIEAAGLVPLVCVGESAHVRESGGAAGYVAGQLAASVPASARQAVVAYEPVWAIGSGVVPAAQDIAAMHATLKVVRPAANVLYGGSVNPENISDILGISGVDGVLIGGASLKLDAFCSIVAAAEAF